jgi:hypothetical protein
MLSRLPLFLLVITACFTLLMAGCYTPGAGLDDDDDDSVDPIEASLELSPEIPTVATVSWTARPGAEVEAQVEVRLGDDVRRIAPARQTDDV